MRKLIVVAVVGCLGLVAVGSVLFRHSAKPVTVNVDFRLSPLEKDEGLPGVPVRLVFGDAAGWQDKDAGHRLVTDSDGRAKFTTTAVIDRRWKMVPVAMTPFSIPQRFDHLKISAQLDQDIPRKDGQYDHVPWLHTLDLDCTSSQCSTSDI